MVDKLSTFSQFSIRVSSRTHGWVRITIKHNVKKFQPFFQKVKNNSFKTPALRPLGADWLTAASELGLAAIAI